MRNRLGAKLTHASGSSARRRKWAGHAIAARSTSGGRRAQWAGQMSPPAPSDTRPLLTWGRPAEQWAGGRLEPAGWRAARVSLGRSSGRSSGPRPEPRPRLHSGPAGASGRSLSICWPLLLSYRRDEDLNFKFQFRLRHGADDAAEQLARPPKGFSGPDWIQQAPGVDPSGIELGIEIGIGIELAFGAGAAMRMEVGLGAAPPLAGGDASADYFRSRRTSRRQIAAAGPNQSDGARSLFTTRIWALAEPSRPRAAARRRGQQVRPQRSRSIWCRKWRLAAIVAPGGHFGPGGRKCQVSRATLRGQLAFRRRSARIPLAAGPIWARPGRGRLGAQMRRPLSRGAARAGRKLWRGTLINCGGRNLSGGCAR